MKLRWRVPWMVAIPIAAVLLLWIVPSLPAQWAGSEGDRLFHEATELVREIIGPSNDHEVWGSDFWQAPRTTLEMLSGDCEDRAILVMWMIHLQTGLSPRLAIGTGRGSNPDHAWVEFNGYHYDPSVRRDPDWIPSETYRRIMYLTYHQVMDPFYE